MARRNLPPCGPQLKLSGALGVAFVNTAAARPDNSQLGVEDYGQLLTWGQRAEIVSASEAERLTQVAARHPDRAKAVYARADQLRRNLARIFVAVSKQAEMPRKDLDAFNQALAHTMPAARLVPGKTGLTWGWAGDEDALERVLWPVLHSVAELLVSMEGQPHVRLCAGMECGLFFVDRTPSGQRKWCEMKTCGNRAKVLRHYYRTGRKKRDESKRRVGWWVNRRPRARRQSDQES